MENKLLQGLGAKARSLVSLSEAGFSVPQFSVVPFSVYLEARKSQCQEIPLSFVAELDLIIAGFQGKPVAVRSSASHEDGEKTSFAGLFETYLNVSEKEGIKKAILDCWKSTLTERTIKYCQKNNLDPAELEMAVVIQEYIEPDYAGVLFTMNPITGNDQELLMEACPGAGDKLVSGLINPSRFSLSLENEKLFLKQEDITGIHPLEKTIAELRQTARRIQAFYGKPQDIEFAVKNEKIFILQSRDITKIQFSPDMGEWTTADFRDGGVSSAVVSPVMWSLYEKIFITSMPKFLQTIKMISAADSEKICWYKVFYGKPYWNLEAIKKMQSSLPGYNERNFDKDMAIPVNYEGDGVTTPFSVGGILRALPIITAVRKEYGLQKARSEKLISDFLKMEKSYQSIDYPGLSANDLKQLFKTLVLKDFTYIESEYFQTIYNASNAKLEFSDELKHYKEIDPTLEYVNLIAELGELKVTGPAHFLSRTADELRQKGQTAADISKVLASSARITLKDLNDQPLLKEPLSKFVDQYYFHSERELDLLVPRWGEDLRFALETLRSIMESQGGQNRESNRHEVYQNEIAKLKVAHGKSWKRFLPGSWSRLMKKLELIRYYLWLREEVRDRSTRMYYFIRCHLLELGKRTALNDRIFFLSYQQIIQYLDEEINLDQLTALSQSTKLYADGYRKFKNSNEIGYRFNNANWKAVAQVHNGKTSYTGIGCSAGVLRGKACVIKDIVESSKLKQGEIMVVPFTDPGWTPLFSLAAGVVTETGGLLSHAALISREYGIPCVLNINGATDSIPDGSEIEIDGNSGRVTLL